MLIFESILFYLLEIAVSDKAHCVTLNSFFCSIFPCGGHKEFLCSLCGITSKKKSFNNLNV